MNISKYSNSCENAKVPIADLNPGRIFSCDGNLYMKIENGSEEVAEIEMTIAVSPDDQGFGKYECMASELASDSQIASKWLTNFNFDLIKKA